MVTLKDIAEKTGVTVSTVSAALNGRGNMREETRDYLLRTAKEMGYEPNSAARQLRNKPAVDVGLIINDKYTNLRRGGTYLAHISEFLSLCSRGGLSQRIEFYTQEDKDNTLPELIRDKIAGGVIHVGYLTAGVRRFLEANPEYPLVVFGEPGFYSVRAALEKGAYQAIQYLAALGHRNVMVSLGPVKYDYHRQISQGVKKAFRDFGLIRLGEELSIEPQAEEDEEHYMERMFEWSLRVLEQNPRPTAFYCSGSFTGRSLISAAFRLGLRIPEDLSIVTHGIVNEGSSSYPELTSVELNFNGMYTAALSILQQIRNGCKPIQNEVWVDPLLVIQQSTAAPPKRIIQTDTQMNRNREIERA